MHFSTHCLVSGMQLNVVIHSLKATICTGTVHGMIGKLSTIKYLVVSKQLTGCRKKNAHSAFKAELY